jgi:5-hydroxyisourate hydrolase-like protein (transthyretin family)
LALYDEKTLGTGVFEMNISLGVYFEGAIVSRLNRNNKSYLKFVEIENPLEAPLAEIRR